MKVSDLIKCQIIQNQVKALMDVNSQIANQMQLNRDRLYEVKDYQKSVNEQLDKYKQELSVFDDVVISNEDCLKQLGFAK